MAFVQPTLVLGGIPKRIAAMLAISAFGRSKPP
jgi:hypothetical protein